MTTPIFDQLVQEYAAKEAYDRFFNESDPEKREFIVSSGLIHETIDHDDES